jgi:hypothetical protein
MCQPAAILVFDSHNAKLGPVAATYASIEASCPASCSLKGNGCYAHGGNVALHVRRLDASKASPLMAARDEADAIDASPRPRGKALRLHVAGDCSTIVAANTVAAASGRWLERGGGPVWTYTHAWRSVPRTMAWERVSALASIETAADAKVARRAGYAPALVVAEHPADGRAWKANGITWIPCPAQTRDNITCADCRLCWDDAKLKARNAGITFAVHGSRKRRALTVIQ